MATDNEKFVKLKRFSSDHEFDTVNNQVLVKSASTEQAGKIQLATPAEAAAGTDTTKAVTAEGVAAAIAPILAAQVDVFGNLAMSYSDTLSGLSAGAVVSFAPTLSSGTFPSGTIFAITPAIPDSTGLAFNTSTGVIAGTVATWFGLAGIFTATATWTGGSALSTFPIGTM